MSARRAWSWADYERTAYAEELRARARERRERLQRHGEGGPAPVACAGPAHDGQTAGRQAGGCTLPAPCPLGARDPRPSPCGAAARATPPDPCDQVGHARAVSASPGVCWARDAMARGISLDKVLRTAGDRLTWRDRAALQAAP